MSAKIPIVRQISPLSLLFHLILIVIMFFLFSQVDPNNAFLYSIVTFILILLLVRYIVPVDHRRGIHCLKNMQYEIAIQHFIKSLEFFRKYIFVDKYRYIFILSSSRISYTEMALLNIAFCQSQLGNKEESIKTYKKIINDYSDNEIAKASLKMLEG